MRNVLLLSEDKSLRKEVAALLPKGYKLALGGKTSISGRDEYFVIVDIDTAGAHIIKEYSGRTFVMAVTDQERP